MSFDPFAAGPDLPPEYGPTPPPAGDRTYYARQRVQGPAIALIVVGVLNLLLMLFQVGRTVLIALQPAQQLVDEQEDALAKMRQAQLSPEFLDAYEQQLHAKSPAELKTQTVITAVIITLLGLLIAVLSFLGGVRMRNLRSYGLSVAGAISAALPCLSCSGTCCFGEIIGIWALVVLLNPEVRASFH